MFLLVRVGLAYAAEANGPQTLGLEVSLLLTLITNQSSEFFSTQPCAGFQHSGTLGFRLHTSRDPPSPPPSSLLCSLALGSPSSVASSTWALWDSTWASAFQHSPPSTVSSWFPRKRQCTPSTIPVPNRLSGPVIVAGAPVTTPSCPFRSRGPHVFPVRPCLNTWPRVLVILKTTPPAF